MNDKRIELRADLEFANRRLSALTQLNLLLASERDPDLLLDQVCRGARKLIGSRFSAMAVRDLTSGECLRFNTWGLSPEDVACLGRPQIDGGIFAQIMSESRSRRFINPEGDPTLIGISATFPQVRSALVAPLVSLNHCYGWVFLGDKMGAEAFTDEDERLLVMHAAQAGRIYENGTLSAKANRHGIQRSLVAHMAQRHPLRVLVAEDNPVNIKLISIIMQRLGYGIDVAGDGLEAIAALRRQTYDVILMDVQMPKMDGIEATRNIFREWRDGSRPRIIALSAGVMPEERQACLDAGIEQFLTKPVVLAQLMQALERCKRLVE